MHSFKNNQNEQNLDTFYELSNEGLLIVLFYSVLHHLFCMKTCYILQIMAIIQKWLTAWLFDNVLESDGKMNHLV